MSRARRLLQACAAALALAAIGLLPHGARADDDCPAGTVLDHYERSQSGTVVTVTPVCRRIAVRPSAFVGGTTWQLGYYSPIGASPAVRERAMQMLRQQARAAGIAFDEAIDFDRYNFAIGIAASTDAWTDLSRRVVLDELANGQYTANYQNAYNSLRGRDFDELGCHSNGAMICLAALENHDVKARHVVLYGPQITYESLRMWDQLVRDGRVGSIELFINDGDPVPPVSLLAGAGTSPAGGAVLFSSAALQQAIAGVSPSISVRISPCDHGQTPSLSCHAMTLYKQNRK